MQFLRRTTDKDYSYELNRTSVWEVKFRMITMGVVVVLYGLHASVRNVNVATPLLSREI